MKSIFDKNVMGLDIRLNNKRDTLEFMVHLLEKNGYIKHGDRLIKEIMQREGLSSTYIGDLIAIPHAQSENVVQSIVSFVRMKDTIRWDEIGNVEVKMIFLFVVGIERKDFDEHIYMLSKIAKSLSVAENISRLIKAKESQEIIEIMDL